MKAAWISLQDTIYKHSYRVFRIIYQKIQRLVWWEPCQDHGPHEKKHAAHLYDPQCTTKKDALRSICSTKNDMKKTFTVVWRRSMHPLVLAHLCFWVEMESSSCQRRTWSWRSGMSISTGHLSTRPFNDCCIFQ